MLCLNSVCSYVMSILQVHALIARVAISGVLLIHMQTLSVKIKVGALKDLVGWPKGGFGWGWSVGRLGGTTSGCTQRDGQCLDL